MEDAVRGDEARHRCYNHVVDGLGLKGWLPGRKLNRRAAVHVQDHLRSMGYRDAFVRYIEEYGMLNLEVRGIPGIDDNFYRIFLGYATGAGRCFKLGLTLAEVEDLNKCHGSAAKERMAQAAEWLATGKPEELDAARAEIERLNALCATLEPKCHTV